MSPTSTSIPLSRRAFWGLASQVLSSAGNFSFGVIISHQLDGPEFGVFALTFAIYIGAVQVVRVFSCGPFMILRTIGELRSPWFSITARKGVLVGILLGLALCGAGSLSSHGSLVWPLAVGLPILLFHEVLRQDSLGAGKPEAAALADAIWTGLFIFGLVVASWLDRLSALTATLAWLTAAAIACAISLQGRRFTLKGWRHRLPAAHRRINAGVAGEYAVVYLSTQGLILALPLVAGLELAGVFRAASQNVLGLVAVITMGVVPQLTYEFRSLSGDPARLRWFSSWAAVAMASVSLTAVCLALMMPDRVGELLAGDLWTASRDLILPAGALMISATWATLRIIPLRFGVAPGALRAVRTLAAAPSLLLPLALGSLHPPLGLTIGCLIAAGMTVALSEVTTRRLWRQYELPRVID